MEGLDAALNELGMLSNVTSCRLEYLQASTGINQSGKIKIWVRLLSHIIMRFIVQARNGCTC